MKFISRDGRKIIYEADFWEAPCEAGHTGKYVRCVVVDRIVDRRKTINVNGILQSIKVGERLANTAPNVSYYSALERAAGFKWGAV